MTEIQPEDLRTLCNKVKERGAPATAVQIRDIVKQVYVHAIHDRHLRHAACLRCRLKVRSPISLRCAAVHVQCNLESRHMLQEWANLVDAWGSGQTYVPTLMPENVVVPVLHATV